MSRVGKKIIELPEGVNLSASEGIVKVKGPKGELSFTLPAGISVKLDGKVLQVQRENEDRGQRSLHGLARNMIQNMVTGVSAGFSKDLEINGVGYRADMKGKDLQLALGYSHPILFPIPQGIQIKVKDQTKLSVEGVDKSLVGQTAAEIRDLRPPEPYRGKGIKYADETIVRKVGKAAGAQGG